MSAEENKALIRRFVDGLGRGDLSVMDECLSEAFMNHRIDGTVMDRAGYKRLCSVVVKSPDTQVKMDEMLSEGERATFRFTMTWTDKTGFMGKPPSGKRISMSEAHFVGFDGGKISEFINFQAQPRRE